MARITKYLLLALIVAIAFNHAAKAQEEEAPAPEAEAEAAAEPAPEEPAAAPVEEEPAPAEAEPAAEPEVGSALEEEDNFSLGSIKKVGSWLSKFGWWNIWKGIGLKKAGDWWKWDKIFKEDWWKKKWFVLGSPLEEESRMMLVLSDPDARSSMGINGEEDATYFLAPPGFENELAKRGIAVNPSIVPVSKTHKKQHHQRTQQQRPHHQYQEQRPLQYAQQQPRQLQNTQYPQSWLQRTFPSLDVYDREGGQGSEIDSVRMKPNTQSLSRSMVASLRQQIPDIIPLGSSVPNTPMYAYDKNGVMQLIQEQTLPTTNQQYQTINEDTQNPAVLKEYQQARHGFQEILGKTKKPQLAKTTRMNSKTEPEELLVPMPFPRSNSITTKEELERALNDEQTQKMLEQYARKNWKTIRKDAIILKFLPKADMEARPSVKRQACAMIQEQMPKQTSAPRQMTIDLPEQINSAHARDMQQWASHQQRAMQMQDQDQKLRQMTQPQMQEPREELPQPIMQHRSMAQQQQNPTVHQEPRQTVLDQTAMNQQPAIQQHTSIDHNQQQEPRQWLQEQPITQQMPRQWIQEQPQQQPNVMVQQETVPQNEPRQWMHEQPHQQQHMMVQQETMPQNEPRQWVQEQQWTSVDPSVIDEMKPRQMTHQTLEQTQNTQTQQGLEGLTVTDGGKLENQDDQHPIVSEMGPQTEDNARFFKKVLMKKRPSNGAHYVTHNYNIYNSDGGHASGGYGSGYGGSGSYGGGSSYGVGSSYGSSQSAGYGGSSGASYGSSGHSGSYSGGHSGSYSGGHSAGHGGYGAGHGGYGAGHGGYGAGASSGYGSSATGSYGAGASYGSTTTGSYGGHSYSSPSSGYGGSHGSGYGSTYGAGHGSSYGGSHSGGYRTAEMGGNPMTQYQLQDSNPYRSQNPVHNHQISHVDEQKLSHSSEPPQNQQAETNQEYHLIHNERTTSPTAEHHYEADEASRLASKPNLRHFNSLTDNRVKTYPTKRKVSELGDKKVIRARRSIPSSRDLRRSRRQVSYGGSQGYSALESIAPSSLQKLREGYKENLKEITLQPNEDPAEALMRLNSQSIQEALYRASSEPIEVDGVPGQTVVHNEGSGQPIMQRQPTYQSQWASQSPLYTSDNVRAPIMYNNGHFYPDSAQNETVHTVSSVPFPRHDIPNARTYGVQHYVNQEQDYGNGAHQSVDMMMPQGRAGETIEYERSNIHPTSITQNRLPPRYETQFQNQVFQPNTQVLSNPTYFYQQPNIPQAQYQTPSAPIDNYNQYSAPRTEVPSISPTNYNQFSAPRSEVHQSAPIGTYNQFTSPRTEITATPIGNYNQFSVPLRQEIQSTPIGNYNQFSVPRSETPSTSIGNYNQFTAPRSEIKQFSAVRPDIEAPMRYSDHLRNTADATLRGYIENQLVNPSTNSVSDLMEAIKKRLTTCCYKCKNQILKGITAGITPKNDQRTSDDEEEEEECLTCKASAEFLSDLKSLQNDFLKNSKTKSTPRSNANNEKEYKSENTFRYYRDPNALNRQKATQAMWVKKPFPAEENKENVRSRLNSGRHFDDIDYDYNVEGEYEVDQKPQSNRSNQERNTKKSTTIPEHRRSDRGYSYKSRAQSSKTEHPSQRVESSSSNSVQQHNGDYEKRRTQGNIAYRRVSDAQGQRRLPSRPGTKDNKSSNYAYEKEVRHENSNKNVAYTSNPVRVRKPKTKQEQSDNESPCKKIQKQLKELEAETRSAKLENDDDNQSDILVEKKAKLIELLYFLYEMSKSSMGEQCQKTNDKDEVPSSTMSSIAKDDLSVTPVPEQNRHVKIPRKKEVKILDYSTVKQAENNSKNDSDGKKVRSVENSNYSGEDW